MDLSTSCRSKGQTFMPDYLASLLIFGVLIGIFLSSWNLIASSSSSGVEMVQARHTSTFLVATTGYPENWENESVDVRIPGFASEDHVLDPEKIGEFGNMSYEKQSELLQTEDFRIEIRNDTGTIKLNGENASFGESYVDASQIYPIRRSVLVNRSGNVVNAELVYVSWE